MAINPFKRLPIYSRGWVKHYKGKRLGLLSPHIFAVAEQTYNQMSETGANQSVLVRYAATAFLLCLSPSTRD